MGPDFSPAKFNARSGATVIGAREFLIAYNVTLNSRDKELAMDIASELREKGRVARPRPHLHATRKARSCFMLRSPSHAAIVISSAEPLRKRTGTVLRSTATTCVNCFWLTASILTMWSDRRFIGPTGSSSARPLAGMLMSTNGPRCRLTSPTTVSPHHI